MSYIVPMKKPICINCPFRSLDSCTLIYLMSDKDSEVTVHVNEMTVSPDCPLVEIPTPHGRLIDADAVNKAMDERIKKLKDDKSIYEASCVSTALDMFAPTVIEAEGSETDA